MLTNPNLNKPFVQLVCAVGGGCSHMREVVPGLTMGRHDGGNVQALFTTVPLLDAQVLSMTTAIVLQSPFGGEQSRPMVQQIKALQGKFMFKLIGDFDDLSFWVPGGGPNKYSINADAYDDETARRVTEECKQYVRLFDVWTTTNARLAHQFHVAFGDDIEVRIVPNALNRWGYSRPVQEPIKERIAKPVLFFQGSGGHSVPERVFNGEKRDADNGDFDSSAWIDWIAHGVEQNRFDFMCFGCGLPPGLQSIANKIRILDTWIDPIQYAGFISRLKFDMIVAPLKSSIFNSCKSFLRAEEAYINGVPCMASTWGGDPLLASPYDEICDPVELVKADSSESDLNEQFERIMDPAEYNRLRGRGYELLVKRGLIAETEQAQLRWQSAWLGGPNEAAGSIYP